MKPRTTASSDPFAFPALAVSGQKAKWRRAYYYGIQLATIHRRHALPNTLELRGDVPALEPGQSFTLEAVVSQAAPKAHLSLIQANLCFDLRYFDIAFIPAPIPGVHSVVTANATRQFEVEEGPFVGSQTAHCVTIELYDQTSGARGVHLPVGTVFGAFVFTVRRVPKSDTVFGWTNALIPAPHLPESVCSQVVTSAPTSTACRRGLFYCGCLPAPQPCFFVITLDNLAQTAGEPTPISYRSMTSVA